VVVLWLETTRQEKNSVELEATLAPAEAEVGAVAKADQKQKQQAMSLKQCLFFSLSQNTKYQICKKPAYVIKRHKLFALLLSLEQSTQEFFPSPLNNIHSINLKKTPNAIIISLLAKEESNSDYMNMKYDICIKMLNELQSTGKSFFCIH
jgi:hypothetical protein